MSNNKQEKYYCPHCGYKHRKPTLVEEGIVVGDKEGVVLQCDWCKQRTIITTKKELEFLKKTPYEQLFDKYTKLKKDKEQLQKDFKDLYGRYTDLKKEHEKNLKLYGIAQLSNEKRGLILTEKEKSLQKVLDENKKLKIEIESYKNGIQELKAQVLFEEVMLGENDELTPKDLFDILNAWNVIKKHLCRTMDFGSKQSVYPTQNIEMYQINSERDSKEFETVMKVLGKKIYD